ncbi:MAG TPA: ChaN family lipoprotein [Dissulfurispiraceae bacterium]|nr:ChaN family lipoprotein [Dissulfurispiraceae bacterium]
MLICTFLAALVAFTAAVCSAEEPKGVPVENPLVIDLAASSDLSGILQKIQSAKVIFIGEEHPNFAHHDVQLAIIRALAEQGKRVAIGMEMFQVPYQGAFDRYLHRESDERRFLKESHYFKRWGYDYSLYKPIIDFARQRGLELLALNAPREVTDAVSKRGLNALSPSERSQIAKDIDTGDTEYREVLRKVYNEHPSDMAISFEFFVEAQLVWDETMAETAAAFLAGNPDATLVVLAGNGHLMCSHGIPKRLKRRTGLQQLVILQDVMPARGVADYLVYPKARAGEKMVRLGLALKDNADGVRVDGFSPHGDAERAGIRADDVIVAIDDQPIAAAEDVRIVLFGKKVGDDVRLKVRRRILFWTESREIKVQLK